MNRGGGHLNSVTGYSDVADARALSARGDRDTTDDVQPVTHSISIIQFSAGASTFAQRRVRKATKNYDRSDAQVIASAVRLSLLCVCVCVCVVFIVSK